MRDSFGLEPPNGDYVAYIEGLQAGKITNLDPLKIAGESISEEPAAPSAPAGRARRSAPQPASREIPGETASERLRRRAAEENRLRARGPFAALAAFLGFALFAVGSAMGYDALIFIGMAVIVLGFSTASRK